jgi:hypothetical protein
VWFSKNKNQDAFEERQRQQQVWKFLRRIIDSNAPNIVDSQSSDRVWERSNRCIPIALVPICKENFCPEKLLYGSTKELSDNGLCVIAHEQVDLGDCVCGFWLDGPALVSGVVRRVNPFGGSMFEVGIELHEMIQSPQMVEQCREYLHALVPSNSDAPSSKCASSGY